MKNTQKRLLLYGGGLWLLAMGASLSIRAQLGVSPVTSLAYSVHLTTQLSMGVTTVLTNILFIITQALLNRQFDGRAFMAQLLLSVVFGLLMDFSLWLLSWLPQASTGWLQATYLWLSLWIIALGLIAYFTAKLPLMPYDALSFAIKNRFNMPFGHAKISGDVINVLLAASLCWTVLQHRGAIGIGTLVAAVAIGKIMAYLLPLIQPPLWHWLRLTRSNKTRLQQRQQAKLRRPTA